MQTRRGGAGHLAQRLVGDICPPGKLAGANQASLQVQGLQLVLGYTAKDLFQAFGHGLGNDQISEAFKNIFNKASWIQTGLDDAVNGAEEPSAVSFVKRQGHFIQKGRMGIAQQGNGGFVIQRSFTGTSHQLVKNREGIADRTATCTDNQRKYALGYRDMFAFAQNLQVRQQGLWRNQAEGVVVGTGANGPDNLLGFGRCEDELDVRWWLFNDFQQGVEACRGHHMGLIDDEDLVAVACRRESCPFAQVAGIVHATVAGSVNFDNIQRPRAAIGQLNTARAGATRYRRWALLAVQATCQDSGGSRLAATAWAGEEVRVINAVFLQSRHQGSSNVLLSDDVGKRIGTIPAI